MKNILKVILTSGVILLLSSSVFANESTRITYDNSTQVNHTYQHSDIKKGDYLPVFIPSDTSTEEISAIYNDQHNNYPHSKIVIIKVNSEDKLTANETEAIINIINADNTYTRVIAGNAIDFLDNSMVNRGRMSDNKISARAFCSHKWDETTVGSPYVYYTKKINSYCYDKMQNITRICRRCDKDESFKRSIATVQHDWQYDKNGRYNYECTHCGMRK